MDITKSRKKDVLCFGFFLPGVIDVVLDYTVKIFLYFATVHKMLLQYLVTWTRCLQ